jgi:serine/threonine protein kinase
VKPANLLLNERGSVKVADFGIARVVDETTTGMTMAGTVLGTAGYLSPEQARGEPATPASDVYSLGIVAYELLTGGRPFEGGSSTAEAAAHIHQPVPPASERGVGLPREVDPVFERALAKEPGRRYASARDFVRALCLALERTETRELPVAAPTVPLRRDAPVAVAAPRRRPWVPILAAVGLAAAAIAGVIAAATMGGDPERRPTTGAAEAAPPPAQTEPESAEVTVTQGTTIIETVTTSPPAPPPPPTTAPPAPTPPPSGGNLPISAARSLNNEAFGLMQQGRYREALPLAQRALASLSGTGVIDEAYANYNLGRSLIELGRCNEGLPYIARSEALQGFRREFAEARAMCD